MNQKFVRYPPYKQVVIPAWTPSLPNGARHCQKHAFFSGNSTHSANSIWQAEGGAGVKKVFDVFFHLALRQSATLARCLPDKIQFSELRRHSPHRFAGQRIHQSFKNQDQLHVAVDLNVGLQAAVDHGQQVVGIGLLGHFLQHW